MRGTSRGVLAVALSLPFVVALGCSRATPDANVAPRPEYANQVRTASAAWDTAFAHGDVAALSALYSDSAVSMPYDRPALQGREAIASDFRGFFTDYDARHRTQILDLELAGDWAIERGRYEMSSTPKQGGIVIGESGKHIVVRHLENGAWKIQWEIWNLDTTRTP